MHRDDVVTMVEIDTVSGNIVKTAPKARQELLPPGGNLSQDDLRNWWNRRAVPGTQGMIQRILDRYQIPSSQYFLTMNLGLSLSDHYWIRPVDRELSWEQINLFTNDFRDDIGELQFAQGEEEEKTLDLVGTTVFYPSASTQGELRKKWIIANGKRCLVKGNYGDSFQQSVNEVLASLIHERQNKAPYTRYELCQVQAGTDIVTGCICEDFASKDVEYISAYNVVCSEKKDNAASEFEHFISICDKNGLEAGIVRAFLEYQILSDFLLTNTDRHFNNFGVLRDTNTLTFVGMAPIFDTGNSMFWNNTELPLHDSLLQIPVSSFRKKETDLLRYVRNPLLLDMTLLPSQDEIYGLLEKARLTEMQMEGVMTGYRRKLELVEKLQRGEKIWEYRYKG